MDLHGMILRLLPPVISLIELIGILVITIGALKAAFYYFLSFFTKVDSRFKHDLAYALLLGLQFKMAAEILKTVTINSIEEILLLGSIVLVRSMIVGMIMLELKHDATAGISEVVSSAAPKTPTKMRTHIKPNTDLFGTTGGH